MNKLQCGMMMIFLTIGVLSVPGQDLGIMVSPSGLMIKDGKPYRSIGGNVPFDSWKWFEADETHYLKTFADMKASGIKTVRLSTKGWYAGWKISSLSISDKAAYFAKMDAIIDAAAQNDVGVILLLFWWVSAVSDNYGEPEIAATIPGSKTYTAMAQFATDMAEHYKDNSAVVGYDVINEANLGSDLPNSDQSVTGRWTAEGLQVMYTNLLQAIRAVDTKRLLSTGGTDARGNQFHFSNYCTWNLDSPAQMTHENAIAHPDPADVLGIHYYPDSTLQSYGTSWEVYNALALQSRKPFYAGEFGNGDGNKPAVERATNFNISLANLIANRVPLMSNWYMGSPQYAEDTVSPTGSLAFAWNAITQANAQYEYGPWTSLSVISGSWSSTGSWASASVPTTTSDVHLPTDASSRTLTISNATAYARNLAVGNVATTDQAATIEISGSGQLVLGQNSTLTFDTTTDGTTPTTYTVTNVHGQFMDSSSRSAILSINQSAGETKPAIVANTVSAYRMNVGTRANISAATGQLNLFDGLSAGTGIVHQTGGTVRVGLDANLAGGTPAGLALGTGGGSPKYLLSNGTLAASGITGTSNAAIDWQGGTISTLGGASMSVGSGVDLQMSASGTHALHVADADQSMTLNAATKISGSGNLTKSGPGKLVLPGNTSEYTYTGTTTIDDGILQVRNQYALPGWNNNGRVFVSARNANNDGTVTAGTLALNVGGAGEWTTGNLGTILGGNKITFGAGSALGIDTGNASGTVTLTTPITGGKSITKLGTGTLTLTPSANNTFTGIATVLGGTLQLGSTGNTIIPEASGLDVRAGGTLDLGGKSITLSAAFQATTPHPDPALSWAPFLTQPSRVTFAGGTVQNGTINNNTSASGFDTIYDAQSGTVSANLAGSAMLWKTTSGTLTLTGDNAYSGGTRIAKGMLILGHANALGTTGDIVFKNGTLKYATGVTTDLSSRFKDCYSAICIDCNNQTITFASPISASNRSGLKKVGAGTLILAAANSYTGGTWIAEGTLRTDVAGALPASAVNDMTFAPGGILDLNGTSQTVGNLCSMGTGSIVNNKSGTQATLTVSGAKACQFTGVLADHATGTGTLALSMTGTGRLILGGTNTFTGPTTVSTGVLQVSSASGPALCGTVTIGGGTWLFATADNQFGPNSTLNLTGEIVLQNTRQTVAGLTGGGVIQNDHLYSGAGLVTNGTATLTVNNSVENTFNGLLRDNALGNGKLALVKTGNGTLILNNDNTFTVGTTVDSGTLALTGPNGARPSGAGTLTINSGGTVDASAGINNFGYYSTGTVIPVVLNGGALLINPDNHMNALTLRGGSVSGGGTAGSGLDFNTSASVAPTINSLSNSTAAIIGSKMTFQSSVRVDVAAGGGPVDLLATGMIAGSGGLVKTGNGILVLSGANTYTGATAVSNGVLTVNGTLLSTAGITVNSGAMLSGTGAVARVTIGSGGTLAPGLSVTPGELRTGNLTVEAGGALTLRLGTSNDAVKVTGDLVLNGTVTLVGSGGTVNGLNQLFTYTGSFSGTPILVAPAGYVGALDTSEPGVLRVLLKALLPFAETFEDTPAGMANVPGPVDGQRGWLSQPPEAATVQTNRAYAGQKAAALQPDTILSHAFTNGGAVVWCDFFVQAERVPAEETIPLARESSVAFHLDSAGRVVMQSGASWYTCATFATVNNEWVRFTVRLDYAARKWDLYATRAVSGGTAVRVGRDLDFVAGSANAKLREFRLSTDGEETTYLDNLSITDAAESGTPVHLLGTLFRFF